MITTTPGGALALSHVRALCVAIDAGDDSAMSILADVLEDIGLGRQLVSVWNETVGWHEIYKPYRPSVSNGRYLWHRGPTFGGHVSLDHLPRDVFNRLSGSCADDGWGMADGRPTWRTYPTLGAAYLALAEALGD